MSQTTDSKLTELYRTLHADEHYGNGSEYLSEVSLFIDYLQPKTVLDYGCGKGALIKELACKYPEIEFYGYDPSVPGRESIPLEKADLVINTDVLEHIPVDLLPNVLAQIAEISEKACFMLHHGWAYAILADGQNAHCTVRPPIWYHLEIMKVFGDAITVLPGHDPFLSFVATFPVHAHVINQYYDIVNPKPTNQQIIVNNQHILVCYCSEISRLKRKILQYKILRFMTFGMVKQFKRKKRKYRNKLKNLQAKLNNYDKNIC